MYFPLVLAFNRNHITFAGNVISWYCYQNFMVTRKKKIDNEVTLKTIFDLSTRGNPFSFAVCLLTSYFNNSKMMFLS